MEHYKMFNNKKIGSNGRIEQKKSYIKQVAKWQL